MKFSMAYLLPKRGTGLETAVWAAKILFLSIGIASTVAVTARFAVPYFLTLLSSSVPKIWNSALSWLAPPYLFITIHFIVIVIWKLHSNQRPDQDAVDGDESAADDSSPLPLFTEFTDDSHVSIPEPSSEIHSTSTSDVVGIEKSIEQLPWPPSLPEPESEVFKEEDHDYPDGLDATWKAIMDGRSSPIKNQLKKSDTWERTSKPTPTLARAVPVDSRELRKSDTFREKAAEAAKKEMRKSKTFRESTTSTSSSSSSVGWRGRDVLVVSHDELFRKVEAFIKMNYEQMRLQRQESEQRRCVEMLNAAC